MKFQLSTALAILAAAPAAFATPVNQESGSKLSKRNGTPPSADQAYFCYTNEKSAGVSNIAIGVRDMREWGVDSYCSANDDGSAARMAAGGKSMNSELGQ